MADRIHTDGMSQSQPRTESIRSQRLSQSTNTLRSRSVRASCFVWQFWPAAVVQWSGWFFSSAAESLVLGVDMPDTLKWRCGYVQILKLWCGHVHTLSKVWFWHIHILFLLLRIV